MSTPTIELQRTVGFSDGRGLVRCAPCNEIVAGYFEFPLSSGDINAGGEKCSFCDKPLI